MTVTKTTNIYLFFIVLLLSFECFSQSSWERLDGPYGGKATSLETKGDTIIAAFGYKGVIYYSTDAGYSWKKSNIKCSSAITDLMFFNNNKLIAASRNDGIYISNDYYNWLKINVDIELNCLGQDYEGILYAGSDDGQIFKSSDLGMTWVFEVSNSLGGTIYNLVSGQDSTLYAGARRKIFKKTINSSIWEEISFSDTFATIRVRFDESNSIYACSYGYIKKSTDNGLTWTFLDPSGFLLGNFMYDCIFNKNLIGAFGDETSWFGTGWGAAISSDRGVNWRWSNKGLPPKISGVRLISTDNYVYLGTNGSGVYKSTDFGNSWLPVNNGINALEVNSMRLGNNSELYIAA